MPNREPSIEKIKKTPQNRRAKTTREAALDVLHTLFQEPDDGTPLPVVLSRAFQSAGLDARDAALLSELTFGVLRRHALLDVLLDSFLKKPGALSAQVRMLLRLGMYELLFMDGIPARATVSELAGLARRRFGQGVGGLVNGVLRSADREAERLHAKLGEADPALASSVPAWLRSLWEKQYGQAEAERFALNTLAQAAPCWRVNMSREDAEKQRERWLALGYSPVGRCGFTSYGLEKGREGAEAEQRELAELEALGALTRQGVSSQLVAEFVAEWIARDDELAHAELWDACCGRGGKTTALLEKGVNVTLASDPAQFRLNELKNAVARLALPEPRTVCAAEQDVPASYPLILLDVPCSGMGTLRRAPELRIRLTPEKLNEAERLQASILGDAWGKLQAGGLLFYATCALNKKENERQLEKFLAGREDATLCEQRLFLPELPGHDALFLAVLKKQRVQ